MKVNFKQPRYVIPLILLPFICIIFYTYKSSFGKPKPTQKGKDSLQDNVADVSGQVKKSTLTDKLDAYRDQFKKSDGYTAIGKIQDDSIASQTTQSQYNENEKHMLDSIEKAVSRKYNRGAPVSPIGDKYGGYASGSKSPTGKTQSLSSDQALAEALNKMRQPPQRQTDIGQSNRSTDPMQLFRQQMALVDSMGKAHDPQYQAEQKRKQEALENEKEQQLQQKALPVSKANTTTGVFNTITPQQPDNFITATIDQDITGYAGSRLRIRLLDDMMAGHSLIKQGTYLYAQISGFSGQRVLLTISSVMQSGHILPVKLELYDNDGLPGLYVPASAFRDFTKDLGSNASGGLTLQQQADGNSQMVMSVVQRMFESTTTAVSNLIKQNKAKLKYNTLVYLIDPRELKNQQNN